MEEHVCRNPKCGKTYAVKKQEVTDGCCSFECWEAVNCAEPHEAVREEITVD